MHGPEFLRYYNREPAKSPSAEELIILKRAALPLNDSGNGKRLKMAFDGDILKTSSHGWATWNGYKYSAAEGFHAAEKMAAQLSDLLLEEATTVGFVNWDTTFSLPHRSDLEKFALDCGNMPKRRSALQALSSEVFIKHSDLDTKSDLLTLKNGAINLKTFSEKPSFPRQDKQTQEAMRHWASQFFKPNNRKHYITKAAAITYDPTAKCPNWRAFIRLIQPDKEIRDCLQRCLGAMLYGSNESHVALMFRGGGGNGKSTLLNIMARVLGDYATTCQVEIFLTGRAKDVGQASPEEMGMPAARLVIASEPGKNDTLSGKAIKAFTGGDQRSIRDLHQKNFTYYPTAIPVLQFNRTPHIIDEDEGLRRRLVFIPFDVALHKLPEKQRRSPQEVNKVLMPELPGILNWLLEGYKKYALNLKNGVGEPMGIAPPPVMLALKNRILQTADPVGQFLAECTTSNPKGRIPVREFNAFLNYWTDETDKRDIGPKLSNTILFDKGYRKKKSGGNMFVLGASWSKTEDIQRYRQKMDAEQA